MFIDVERERIGGGFSLYFYHGDGMSTHLMYGERIRILGSERFTKRGLTLSEYIYKS